MEIENIKRQMELKDMDYQKQYKRNSKKLQIIDYSQALPNKVNKFIKFGWANLNYLTFPEIVSEFKKKYETKKTKEAQQ